MKHGTLFKWSRFKELGEWNALGIVEYEDVTNPLVSSLLPTARPLSGNSKNFPLINEIVLFKNKCSLIVNNKVYNN